MVQLIKSMAEALVGNPGDVQVLETRGGQTAVYELSVAKEDLGRIIGKRGQTVKSMRTILNAVSSKSNKKVLLEIVE